MWLTGLESLKTVYRATKEPTTEQIVGFLHLEQRSKFKLAKSGNTGSVA